MDTKSIFPASQQWIGAEGARDGKPVMYRGRMMHDSLIGAPEFPHIFVITRQYEVTDFTGLPTSADYQELGKFETRCIDRIETLQLGIVTFIETFDGIVRYFLYVSDVVAATNALNDANASHMHLELATAHDPHWNEYRAFLRGTQRANDVE